MNEKIIAMVRRSPGIKTGQIADQLDVDFDEAQEMLGRLVIAGDLKGALVQTTGGGKVMAYELTDRALRAAPVVPKFLPDGTKNPEAPLPPALVAELSKPAQAAIAKAAPAPEKRAYNRRTPPPKPPTTDSGIRQVLGLDEAKPAASDSRSMRCCLWSDGILEVQRDGCTPVTFDAAEQLLLAKAMGFEV